MKWIWIIKYSLKTKLTIDTVGLINAVYRALLKKKNKYKMSDKISKSVLVILDESHNTFYYAPLNSNHFPDKISQIKNWHITDFLKAIFFVALEEIKEFNFFDEIQVYFKIYDNENKKYFVFVNGRATIVSMNIDNKLLSK